MASYVSTFTGDGSEVHFTAGFPVLRLTDLAVVVDNVWLTLGTDYSVSGSTATPLATLAVAPANGATVTLRSAVGYTPTDPAAVTTAAPTLNDTDTALWEAIGASATSSSLAMETAARISGDAAEAAARAAADAAIIAAGVPVAVSGSSIVTATGTAASLSLADWMALHRDVFVDAVGGNDALDGLTPATAKKTLAAAATLVASGGGVRPSRNRFFESLAPAAAKTYLDIVPFRAGPDTVIDGSRLIASVAWQADPTYAGVWYADVTHATATLAGQLNFMMYQEGDGRVRRFEPYWSGASIDANRAYVASAAGLFTVHKQGSTNPNPRAATETGTAYRYYVRPFDDADISAGDADIFYVEHETIGGFYLGTNLRGLTFQRTGAKDMVSGANSQMGEIEDCQFLEAPMHGFVGGLTFRRCHATARPVYGSSYSGGYAFHLYRDTLARGTSPGAQVLDCKARGFTAAVFSHGSGGGVDDHESVLVRDLEARDCTFAVGPGASTYGYTLENIKAINCASLVANGAGRLFVRRALYISETSINNRAFADMGMDIEVEDATLIFRGSAGSILRKASGASAGLTMALTRVTNVGGGITDGSSGVILSATDCILGDLGPNISYIDTGFVATNCQLGFDARTLAEIQATFAGVNDDCLVPWVPQVIETTVLADDIAWYNTTRTGTGTTGSTTVTMNYVDASTMYPGQALKFIDWNGAGADFVTKLVSINTTGAGGTITVADAAPGNFAGKACHRAHFSRKIFPDGTATTGRISTDGTQIYLTDARHFTEGMTIRVGGVSPRASFGARKIVTLAGNLATLDRECPWRTSDNTAPTYQNPNGTGNGVPIPLVNVSFGFPLRNSVSLTAMSASVDHAGTVVSGNVASATGIFSGFAFDLTGAGINYGGVRFEDGYIATGFPVAVGDVITITAAAYVSDYDLQWEGDPTMTGHAIPLAGSELAYRKIGSRWAPVVTI